METPEEMDQFQLLEDKVDSLIKYVASVKKDNESRDEKLHIQEEKITDLAEEVKHLKAARAKVKQRIITLLERIEQVDL